jgi:hypothetical protein
MNQEQLKIINEICRQNGITYLGLFGSFARGDYNDRSDVDLLAKYREPLSLLEKGRVINSFQDVLGREVDLVSSKHLKKGIRPYVEKDLKTIYEEE